MCCEVPAIIMFDFDFDLSLDEALDSLDDSTMVEDVFDNPFLNYMTHPESIDLRCDSPPLTPLHDSESSLESATESQPMVVSKFRRCDVCVIRKLGKCGTSSASPRCLRLRGLIEPRSNYFLSNLTGITSLKSQSKPIQKQRAPRKKRRARRDPSWSP